MPTKNITFEKCRMMINGVDVGIIDDLHIVEESSDYYADYDRPFLKPITNEYVIDCKMATINRNLLLYLAYGILPPNNWLKMHNHPMRRRYRKH